jgi:large subunit ribosomal protein L4
MAAVKAPVLDVKGGKAKDAALEAAVFGAEIKPHLVHEAVRAEQNAQRAGTFASKSRGLVSGGRSKPWRQKGTGRARAGTTRAGQFTGGGHIFAKVPRDFTLKVNRKVAKAALRSALAGHVQAGSFALVDATAFGEPSTRLARSFLEASGLAAPVVLVLNDDEANAAKSFRNLERVAIVAPSELEVGAVVWARSLIVSEAALPLVETRARS